MVILTPTDSQTEYWKSLIRESTVGLVERIVEASDTLALKVLLDTRRLFRLKDSPPLLLPEFLLKLRDRLAPPDKFDIDEGRLADCAYDLTLSKYAELPEPSIDCPSQRTGIDCRNYYRAFLCIMERRMAHGKITTRLQEESEAGYLLQKLVYTNFLKSKLECGRRTPFSVRYTWQIKGRKFYLWYPSYMTAMEFRTWLREHVKDIDPDYPGEQRRIQSLIDENFKRGSHISLDELGADHMPGSAEEYTSIEFLEGLSFVESLADTVAQQKAKHIDKLRPAIRRLGEKELKNLVLHIFTTLSAGEYNAAEVAKRFGLSKATMSRFAGSTWSETAGENEEPAIPDLWENTATVLRGNQAFMETVLASGFAGKVDKVLALVTARRGKGDGGR